MKNEAILSFSAPLAERRHIQVRPSSVLELTYAYYFLMKRLDRDRDSNLPWVRQLREDPPVELDRLREVWRKREMDYLGYELFILACGLGYATDPSPDRFKPITPDCSMKTTYNQILTNNLSEIVSLNY